MDNWTYFDEKYGEPIGSGAQCRVYRRGDTVYKVLNPGNSMFGAMREGYALSLVEDLGVPISKLHGVYKENGQVIIEMDFVTGRELLGVIGECVDTGDIEGAKRHIDNMVDIQINMHAREVVGLASTHSIYRIPITNTKVASDRVKQRALDLLNSLPSGNNLCHNDYHSKNVLYDGRGYIVIDWDSATIGDPAGDVAHSYVASLLAGKELADVYLMTYIERSGMDLSRVEKWIPLHAGVLYCTLGGDANPTTLPLRPLIKEIME